jgi:hypothetical protein
MNYRIIGGNLYGAPCYAFQIEKQFLCFKYWWTVQTFFHLNNPLNAYEMAVQYQKEFMKVGLL